MKKQEKKVLLCVCSLFTIIIISALLMKINYDNNNFKIPYNNDSAKKIQNEIDKLYEDIELYGGKISIKKITYKDIYMILVTIDKKSEYGDYNIPLYRSYYYDIKSKSQLTQKQVINKLQYDENKIYSKIYNYFNDLYIAEVEQGYVNKTECDFEFCYLLRYRCIDRLSNYALFVENNTLYAYIGFDKNSLVNDKEFFDKLNYNFYKLKIS